MIKVMVIKALLITCTLSCTYIAAIAQEDCGLKDYKPMEDAIFGPNKIERYGRDTVETTSKNQIIYSCFDCVIFCKNKEGQIRWTRDLSAIGCHLIAFLNISDSNRQKIKGCDILIQNRDNAIFGINSKNGITKKLMSSDIEKIKK